MKANSADCIRKAINISSQKDFFKFDKNTFNPTKIKENLHITSPKLVELLKTIETVDKYDFQEHGKYFKHIIYSDLKFSIAGIKLVASVLTSYGMTNVYDNKLKINISPSNYNFALLTGLTMYEKTFPVKLKNEIINIFNSRPDNVYGENIRFLLIDQSYKEGIDVYDVKYIHLVDDLISKSDEKQAIGRGTRYCGQKGLEFHPQLGWALHVFKYKLLVNQDKYGNSDAFLLYLKEANINVNKLKFAAKLENICKFGAVDYDLNKAFHNFGIQNNNILVNNPYVKLENFKLADPYLSLDKKNDDDFIMAIKARKNFGGYSKIPIRKIGIIQKNKADNYRKVKKISLDHKLDFFDMRRYIHDNFNYLKITNIDFKNECDNKELENQIVKLNNTQEFVSKFFTSDSFYKGMLLWHSVGSGKTCSAIATASNSFEKNNYTILWVTRHTLKDDVWKNMFDKTCSYSIKAKIEKGIKIPRKVDTAKLKYVDYKWIEPLSYKQFTNLIAGKNNFYEQMITRNSKTDPFYKTLIIIDEAHKLYAEDTPANERPDLNLLKKAIYNSYKVSGKNSCKLLLMSATPYTNDPMQLFKLLNLLKQDDYFPENFEDFQKEYLDENTYEFIKKSEFLDKITGYISYLNKEKDVRQFAYPVIYDKYVNITTKNDLNSPETIIKDYFEDIRDFITYNNDTDKSKLIISNIKNFNKKSKKKDDIISQEEALDLCLAKTKTTTKIKDDSDILTDFVKELNDILKSKTKTKTKTRKTNEIK